MRAMDILLFCLCINAAIVLVDSSGMGAMFNPHGDGTTGYMSPEKGGIFDNSLSDISALSPDASIVDYAIAATAWVIETAIFLIKFLVSAVFVLPAMMRIFGFPIWLATFIQVLMYVTYMWAIIQWKSGKSLFSYQ